MRHGAGHASNMDASRTSTCTGRGAETRWNREQRQGQRLRCVWPRGLGRWPPRDTAVDGGRSWARVSCGRHMHRHMCRVCCGRHMCRAMRHVHASRVRHVLVNVPGYFGRCEMIPPTAVDLRNVLWQSQHTRRQAVRSLHATISSNLGVAESNGTLTERNPLNFLQQV